MRRFGLIGYPLTHSFSKNYFTEKFKKEGIIDCSYENFSLESIHRFPKVIVNNPELQGLNVTIPYKESVLNYLDERNHLVNQTGACNCIKIVSGKLFGFNTDVIGFEKSLITKLQKQHANALVLGTGGAAKAVEFVLNRLGIHVTKVSRQPRSGGLTYSQLTPAIVTDNKLIVNTTPVGMYPKAEELPNIPYEGLTSEHFLFDLIYNPAKTLFLKQGEERGANIQNGYDMLVNQAEESWNIWNDDFKLSG